MRKGNLTKKKKTGPGSYGEPRCTHLVVTSAPPAAINVALARATGRAQFTIEEQLQKLNLQDKANHISIWIDTLLRPDGFQQDNIAVDVVYTMNTTPLIIVKLTSNFVVDDILGAHYWSRILTPDFAPPSGRGDKVSRILKYRYNMHGDPSRISWNEIIPHPSAINPKNIILRPKKDYLPRIIDPECYEDRGSEINKWCEILKAKPETLPIERLDMPVKQEPDTLVKQEISEDSISVLQTDASLARPEDPSPFTPYARPSHFPGHSVKQEAAPNESRVQHHNVNFETLADDLIGSILGGVVENGTLGVGGPLQRQQIKQEKERETIEEASQQQATMAASVAPPVVKNEPKSISANEALKRAEYEATIARLLAQGPATRGATNQSSPSNSIVPAPAVKNEPPPMSASDALKQVEYQATIARLLKRPASHLETEGSSHDGSSSKTRRVKEEAF